MFSEVKRTNNFKKRRHKRFYTVFHINCNLVKNHKDNEREHFENEEMVQ